jgi:hypothetical protein
MIPGLLRNVKARLWDKADPATKRIDFLIEEVPQEYNNGQCSRCLDLGS